jgi:hypothetical protein
VLKGFFGVPELVLFTCCAPPPLPPPEKCGRGEQVHPAFQCPPLPPPTCSPLPGQAYVCFRQWGGGEGRGALLRMIKKRILYCATYEALCTCSKLLGQLALRRSQQVCRVAFYLVSNLITLAAHLAGKQKINFLVL